MPSGDSAKMTMSSAYINKNNLRDSILKQSAPYKIKYLQDH